MDVHLGEPPLLGHAHQGKEVLNVGVDTPVAEQTEQVQGSALLLAGVHGPDIGVVLEEPALLDVQGDAGQVLEHHPAGADVGVAHLAVAHLAVGQAHVQAGSRQPAAGIFAKDPVQIRLPGRGDGVVPPSGGGGQTESVHDNECNRFLHSSPFLRSGIRMQE